LLEELVEAGLDGYHASVADERPSVPAAVVVGMDRGLSYRSLAAAQAGIRAGGLFVATNIDPTFPTALGEVPGAGAIVAAVTAAAGVEPVVMGKPGLALAEMLVSTSGILAAQTMFVGDRLTTDVVMGAAAGMITVLVMTGCTTAEELHEAQACGTGAGTEGGGGRMGADGCASQVVLPDHVLEDLTHLPALLDELLG
jgi:ribonucleotide monophosphatase NagD (HAD superfamily)